MWLPQDIVAEIDRVARFYYISVAHTKAWNEHRSEGELRLLTGWTWIAKNGSAHGSGFKTITVAYRDAYYRLVKHSSVPIADEVEPGRHRGRRKRAAQLRVIEGRAAA